MSEYSYVTIPDSISLKDSNGAVLKEITFFEFLQQRLRDPAHFGTDINGILAAVSLEQQFRDKEPGNVVKISKAHATLLKLSIEKPTGGYNVHMTMQAITFLLAVSQAGDTET